MKTKIVDNPKITKKLYNFNIGYLSHPEKATSLCFLGNYRLSDLIMEKKLFRIKKHFLKKNEPSSYDVRVIQKSYIIMLSRKLLNSES